MIVYHLHVGHQAFSEKMGAEFIDRTGEDCNVVLPGSLPTGTHIQTGLGSSLVVPSVDMEVYSAVGYYVDSTGKVRGVAADGKGGLPVVGLPVYAEHETTELLCMYYNMKDGRGRQAWIPGYGQQPVMLLNHVADGGIVEAHNATFEWWIWNMVCVRLYGWPELLMSQCRCSMAKSRRYSLPGGLDKVANILGTPGKNPDGDALIRKLTRPHTPTKNRAAYRWTPQTAPEDFNRLYEYCSDDVAAEDAISAHIPDLTSYEFDTWQMDQTINARGVQVDVEALDACIDILDQAERKYTMVLSQITRGAVGSVSEVAKITEWLAQQGTPVTDLQKPTVEEALKGYDIFDDTIEATLARSDLPVAAMVLKIRQVLGSANVKKIRTLKLQLSSDGRLRDQYSYCGADRTGRWSAGGVQLQNITAKGPKVSCCEACGGHFGAHLKEMCPRCGSFLLHKLPEWRVESVEIALNDIKGRCLEDIEELWGDPVALLCGVLRGLFIAKPGHDLICADFSAVEAVVAACLSRCQWRIDIFSTHGKIYEASAAKATGIPFDEIIAYKEKNGVHHPVRKKVGKIRELAYGFGGWINSGRSFREKEGITDGITDEELKDDVLKWRAESPEIVEMWGGQFRWVGPGKWDYVPELFGLEGASIMAIRNPGKCYSYIDITYGVYDDILMCRLPSGRFLNYHRPRLVAVRDKLNRGPAVQITFEGYNSNSQKGPIGWHVLETYGAREFENVVQAVAADIQGDALKRCEAENYSIVMHTHDEGTAEVPLGFGSVDRMCELLSITSAWCAWWPLRAAGWRHRRFQKD